MSGVYYGLEIRWLLISLCAPKIDLYVDEKIGNLEEVDLTIEITNNSQRIFTLIQNNNFLIVQCFMS